MTDLRDELIEAVRVVLRRREFVAGDLVDAILTHPRIVKIREQAAHARVDADVEADD